MSIKRLAKFMFGVQTDAGWFLLYNFKSQAVCCSVATLKSVFGWNLRLCAFSVRKWPGESQFLLCNLRLCAFSVRKWPGESQFLLCNLAFSVRKWPGKRQFLLCDLRLCAFSVRKWPGESQFFFLHQVKVCFC